jgi:hypothetical protein
MTADADADADADDELRMLRRRREDDALARRLPRDQAPGTPAALGTVYNAGNMPSTVPGQFAVHPTSVSFTETEGATPAVPAVPAAAVFTVLGPHVPGVGDVLTGFLVGSRWVAQRGYGSSPTGPPPCCDGNGYFVPQSLNLNVSGVVDAWLNNATLDFGPNPLIPIPPNTTGYQGAPATVWATTETFPLQNPSYTYGTTFSYILYCSPSLQTGFMAFQLYVYYTSVYIFGQPKRYPLLNKQAFYEWTIGAPGNTCSGATTSFALETGLIYSGGNPQTIATVS